MEQQHVGPGASSTTSETNRNFLRQRLQLNSKPTRSCKYVVITFLQARCTPIQTQHTFFVVCMLQVGILKRVLEEVEKVMLEFKGMLYQSMEDPNIDLTNLENVVSLLLELEPESDPVRRYFSIQNRRIQCLLEVCAIDHDTRMEHMENKLHDKALSDEKWKKIQQDIHESVDISLLHSHHGDSGSEELDALRGRYIRRLTAVLIHHIPPFWKVALSVSSGKFAKGLAEQNKNTSTHKTVEKLDGRYSNHSVEVVSGMIHDTISAYASEVQNTFHDLDESNVLCPYMSDAIMDISKACQAFESKEAAPTNTEQEQEKNSNTNIDLYESANANTEEQQNND